MAKPLNDLVHVLRRVFRFAKYLGLIFLVVTLYMIGREVAGLYRTVAEVNPYLGYGFLAAVIGLVILLLGVPVYRFLKVPVVVTPPKLPGKSEEWKPKDLRVQVEFLEKYLHHVRGNPLLADSRDEIAKTEQTLSEVKSMLRDVKDVGQARAALGTFEKDHIDRILAPLDKEVDRLIRAEALSVGVATAISPNGTLDAFIVLWRNANLVSRIANVYYGRPGTRGSLRILNEVSAAALLATYLEGLTEAAGGILSGVFGSIVGTIAGPVLDGGINALATLRIGHLAKGRCRSFKAWSGVTRREAVHEAFRAAKARSKDVVAELAKGVGGGIAGLGSKVGDAVKGGFGALFGKKKPEPGPA
jgi:hypothetical protein